MRTSSPSVRPAKNGSNSWEPGILRELESSQDKPMKNLCLGLAKIEVSNKASLHCRPSPTICL